jgi:hypothetical protein
VSAVVADELAEQAEALLDLWSRLALRHVALGSACACGAGGVSLRLEDFELDIVDYLQDGGTRSGLPEVERWFAACPPVASVSQPLRQLLESVLHAQLPEPVARWALPRLERTLRSFVELHGGA